LLAAVLILFVFSLMPSIGLAQQNFGVPTNDSALPDAPQPQQNTEGRNTLAADGGSITGPVFDTNRDVLQGARVTLARSAGSAMRTVESGSNGQFSFTQLPPDVYTITVTTPHEGFLLSPTYIASRGSPDCAANNAFHIRRGN